jgi:glycine/D-amino acid oxidase-like deaminating enzyme
MAKRDSVAIVEEARAEVAKLVKAGWTVLAAGNNTVDVFDMTGPEIRALRLAVIEDLLRAAPADLGCLEEVVDRHVYVVGHFERGQMRIAKATFRVSVTREDAE